MKDQTNARRFWTGPRRALALAGAAAALLLAGGVLLFWHNRFGFSGDARLVAARQADGLLLSWPQVEGADSYYVQASAGEETLYEGWTDTPGCAISAPDAGAVTVRVQPARQRNKGAARTWQLKPMEEAPWPALTGFEAEIQPEGSAISFRWEGASGDIFLLYQADAEGLYQVAAQSEAPDFRLTVGDQKDLPLPSYQEPLQFAGGCGVADGDVVYSSSLSMPVVLDRSDFLGTEIQLRAVEEGENTYTLQWNEAKGYGYRVQYCTDDVPEWTDLVQVDPAEEPSCQIKLGSGTHYRLRVVGDAESASAAVGFLSQSQELELTTGLSVEFATVWPVQDLEVYRDTQRQEVIGTAPAAAAYCVLEETDGMFWVRTADGYGYIDSNFCLINLPDYLGELCSYNITNSYDSLYMVHGYEIPGVTGTVITGYENVQVEEGSYLVPLLYPSAQKLAAAAQSTLADGYRIKIYDAYRPREASTEIYQITSQHLEDPIPDTTYTGQPVDDLPVGIPLLSQLEAQRAAQQAAQQNDAQTGTPEEENSLAGASSEAAASTAPDAAASAPADSAAGAGADPAAEGAASSTDTAAGEPAPETQPEPERYLTYHILMTNGGYRLGSFLASSGSTHNLGIAMDLTLERADTGEELEMQTAIHDLSHYSVVQYNNENAELLANYLMDAGFAPLSTEWWHFQDDATRDALALGTYQEKGISLEGWHRDLIGWYYCRADGSRVCKDQAALGDRMITLDEAGYAVETGAAAPESASAAS